MFSITSIRFPYTPSQGIFIPSSDDRQANHSNLWRQAMPIRDAWFTTLLTNALRGTLDRYAIASERARLRDMGEAALADIGLTRRDAQCEARRPFWQGQRCS